jgi:hypothetical protein
MQHNVGNVDRIIRVLAGLALIAATLLGYIGLWGWLGVVLLATGVFRFCPAYLPFGMSTCATKPSSSRVGSVGNSKTRFGFSSDRLQ